MNTSTLQQSAVANKNSVAYVFGARDAANNESCVPEMIFIQRVDQVDYAAGYESVKGVTLTTSQFTGSEMPKPITVPNYKRNNREYVRRTDSAADAVFKADAANDARLDKMLAMTAAFLGPNAEPNILFMAV